MAGFNGSTDAGNVKRREIVNNLTSTATDKPLAAAQGKALNDKMMNDVISTGIENIYAIKNNHTCEIIVNLSSQITISAYNRTQIGTLPNILQPSGFKIVFPCVGRLQDGTAFLVAIEIRTNGEIYAYNTSGNAVILTAIEGTVIYLTQN